MDAEYQSYMKKRYRRLAPFYDVLEIVFSSIREMVADISGAKPGDRVLDVATGTGKQAFAFARRGCVVAGIDLSGEMLAVARGKNRYENVNFQEADATEMPFDDDEFDVVAVSLALHEMSPPVREKAITEMMRVAKPGGTIMVVDYDLGANSAPRRVFDFFFKSFESKHYPGFARFRLTPVLKKFGIEIAEETPIMLKTAAIVKGINRK